MCSHLTTNIHWLCYYTVHVYVIIIVCDSVWSSRVEAHVFRFFVCLYLYCRWSSNYQQRWVPIINRDEFQLSTEMGSNYQQRWVPIINRDGFQLTDLTPPPLCVCPRPGPRFLAPNVFVVLCSMTWGEVGVRFVNICGIAYHHCSIQLTKKSGNDHNLITISFICFLVWNIIFHSVRTLIFICIKLSNV